MALEIPRDLSVGLDVDLIPQDWLEGLVVDRIPRDLSAGLVVDRIPQDLSAGLDDAETASGCCASSVRRTRCRRGWRGRNGRQEEYNDVFAFTDKIKRVTLDLSGELIQYSEADLKIAVARQ